MATAPEYARRLQEIAARFADMTPVMEVVAADTRTYVDERFETGTAPDGTRWADLSDATLMGRARRAAGHGRWNRRRSQRVLNAVMNAKPLLDTGRLRRSFTTQVNKRGFTFGSNAVQAGKMNFGDPANKFGNVTAPVPARPFLPVTPNGRDLAPDDFWATQRDRIAVYILTGELPA